MALMAYLPEESQAPLGWLYLGVGALFAAVLFGTVSARRGNAESTSTSRAIGPSSRLHP